jgi:hypothetical protein
MNTKKVNYLIEAIATASEIYSEKDCAICNFYYAETFLGNPNNSVILLEVVKNYSTEMIWITEGALDKSTISNDEITFVDSKGNNQIISLSVLKPKKIKSNWK